MTKMKILEAVVNLPNRDNQTSSFAYVKKHQICEFVGELDENEIAQILKSNPSLVSSWLIYSEDQRSSDAWYVLAVDDRKFEVGHLPSKAADVFDDAYLAVANFIVKNIKQVCELK